MEVIDDILQLINAAQIPEALLKPTIKHESKMAKLKTLDGMKCPCGELAGFSGYCPICDAQRLILQHKIIG